MIRKFTGSIVTLVLIAFSFDAQAAQVLHERKFRAENGGAKAIQLADGKIMVPGVKPAGEGETWDRGFLLISADGASDQFVPTNAGYLMNFVPVSDGGFVASMPLSAHVQVFNSDGSLRWKFIHPKNSGATEIFELKEQGQLVVWFRGAIALKWFDLQTGQEVRTFSFGEWPRFDGFDAVQLRDQGFVIRHGQESGKQNLTWISSEGEKQGTLSIERCQRDYSCPLFSMGNGVVAYQSTDHSLRIHEVSNSLTGEFKVNPTQKLDVLQLRDGALFLSRNGKPMMILGADLNIEREFDGESWIGSLFFGELPDGRIVSVSKGRFLFIDREKGSLSEIALKGEDVERVDSIAYFLTLPSGKIVFNAPLSFYMWVFDPAQTSVMPIKANKVFDSSPHGTVFIDDEWVRHIDLEK